MVDTPQSITTITGEDLRDLGVTNLNDALRTVPGISLGAGEYSYQGNNLILRGFTTRDDMFVDGQRDYGYYYRDPFDSQDIEVLKGPSSILFGRGSTGGVIDGVSKFPTLTPLLAGTGTVSSSDVRRATLDLGSPVPALGAGDAFRLNLMADHSAVADRATTQSDRWGVAPSLALGLGTPTRVLVSYYHQTENDVPDYGIPWFNNRPAPVDRSNFYGFSGDYLDTDVNLVSARFEHDFGPSMTLSSQARYSRDTRDFRLTEAIVPSGTPASTPIQNITVSRNEFQGYSTDTFYQDQTELTARFATGVLSLALVTGIEVGRESPEPTYITNAGVPGTNLADPTAQNYSDLQSYPRLKADTVANTVGIYGLDTVEFGRHWQLMGGIRWDRFDAHYDSTGYSPTGTVAANTHLDHLDQAFSYRGAIVYTPSRSGSIYVSTGTSFDPSAEGIESLISSGRTLAQANINLAPEKNRAYELGSKWSLPGGLLLTGALFRIEQYNTRVPDPTEPGFNTLGGDERVDGAEIAAVGRLTSAWSLRASYTYMDSKVIRSTPGGPLLGAPLTITPRNSSAVWIEYQLTTPLEIGAGALQMSSRLGQDTAASYEVAPGYVIFNAMAKYQFSTQTTLQLNVDNLTNRYYIDQLHPFHVIPGEGCMAQLALYVHY
jgi:catecholate siderophore receptor